MNPAKGLFRAEAVEHHARMADDHGDVLRFDKRWARVTYTILVFAAVAGFLFLNLFSVSEYASGPAVVRIDGRRTLTASVPSTIDAVDVQPGQLVEPGAVLVRMHVADEMNELQRANRELDLLVVRMLRDPNDSTTKQSIATLRAARDQAKNAIEAKTVRAEIRGYVTDVRVKPGQHVNPGEVLLALAPTGSAQVSLVAVVPADFRPMLKSGLAMRFELDGFRYEYADLDLVDVSAEAVGPTEIQRFLGQERADAVQLVPGAKVLVTARLPATTFSSEGKPYGYYDGLTGNAEIRVRNEPILVTLLPALRQWIPADVVDRAAAAVRRLAKGLRRGRG
jgi:membrane fusion protein (multidrug efflux system)